jgi:HAD superfamily phosphatase (TIGR01668 family)
MFNKDIGVHTICNAHKPGKEGYRMAMKEMGTNKKNTLFIGDQLFTDVWGAKRCGIRNILVKPIHPKEEIQIVLKRRLEWIVLFFYKKQAHKS